MTPGPDWAFVALGANLPSPFGDAAATIRWAATALRAGGAGVLSPLFVTAPVDCPPGSPPFVNAVLALPAHRGGAEGLHRALIALEATAGRPGPDARGRNTPRPLDLDLLAFGALTSADPTLTIPHPRCHLRRFVLAPWAAIAPGFLVPGHGPVADLLAALPASAH